MVSLSRLRTEAREARRSFPDPQGAARAVCNAVTSLGWLDGVQRVAASVTDDGELDPAPLVTACRVRGIDVYLPVLRDPAPMQFAPAGPDTPMVHNRYGIPEPALGAHELVSARELDVVLAPLVVFDAAGRRAGRGQGYYDRALAFLLNGPRPAKPLVVGLAFESQMVDAVPSHPGDVTMDAVVTEQRVRVFSSALSRRSRI
ncbi:5-formyltetrahydrofolate cyclo-ligase [Candidatus Poriferisocius sp.]|uniref:5-formyltetrahydrofolate cyclo-ligase n=1 Tax=Candidatus Poriferisocius sp. TaxID=3101276 RepID=UPI003B0169C3